MNIRPYLDDLEQRIDAATEDQLWQDWRVFSEGAWRGEVFVPRRARCSPPGIEWPKISVNQALQDRDCMVLQQLSACSQQLNSGSGDILNVRCNYGTPILPSLFGVKLCMMDEALNTLPASYPLEGGQDGLRALLAGGVPDVRNGLGAAVLDMGAYYQELFAPYPLMQRYVKIYHPDLQGPMDVTEMLWGSSIFLDVYDVPELVHGVLEVVTRTYSVFMHEWLKIVPRENGCAPQWGMLHRGHVMLRDDSAMNFSPEMFAEFIGPYDRRLLDEFGGGAMHFCGRGDHYIGQASAAPNLYAVNLSQPHLNDMETIFAHTVDKGIVLLDLQRAAADEALARGRALHGRVHCRA